MILTGWHDNHHWSFLGISKWCWWQLSQIWCFRRCLGCLIHCPHCGRRRFCKQVTVSWIRLTRKNCLWIYWAKCGTGEKLHIWPLSVWVSFGTLLSILWMNLKSKVFPLFQCNLAPSKGSWRHLWPRLRILQQLLPRWGFQCGNLVRCGSGLDFLGSEIYKWAC